MTVQNQPRLNFVGMDIHSVQLKIDSPYTDGDIRYVIEPSIFIPKGSEDTFDIKMNVLLEREGFFKIQVELIGHFVLNVDSEDEYRRIFMNQNAPAILFPYVRSFISTLTSNLGSATRTIIIPPQVFSGPLDIVDENADTEIDYDNDAIIEHE